uniref:Uncharacterized protein n=1 Tax=Timema tahoe TaxID=61484 RepID=A0A7R9IBT9_9NEOP|nr:unnamed protein product [Timema tahoe]
MGDSLDGSGDSSSVAENVVIVDYSAFTTYLKKAVTILLPEEEDVVPPALNAALNDRTNQENIQKFLSDPQVSALFVQRSSFKGINTDQAKRNRHIKPRCEISGRQVAIGDQTFESGG